MCSLFVRVLHVVHTNVKRTIFFFSSGYWDVSLPQVPFPDLCIQYGIMRHSPHGIAPFGNPRIKGCLPPPRGLSQAATSFIGTFCQGIHHMHLMLYNHWKIISFSGPNIIFRYYISNFNDFTYFLYDSSLVVRIYFLIFGIRDEWFYNHSSLILKDLKTAQMRGRLLWGRHPPSRNGYLLFPWI